MNSLGFNDVQKLHKYLGIGLAFYMYGLGRQSGSHLLGAGGLFYISLFLLTAVEGSLKAENPGRQSLFIHLGVLGLTGFVGARILVSGLRLVIQPVRSNASPVALAVLIILLVAYSLFCARRLTGVRLNRLTDSKTKETDKETLILHQVTLFLILATILAVKAGMPSWLEASAAVLVGFVLLVRTGMSLVRRIRYSQR